ARARRRTGTGTAQSTHRAARADARCDERVRAPPSTVVSSQRHGTCGGVGMNQEADTVRVEVVAIDAPNVARRHGDRTRPGGERLLYLLLAALLCAAVYNLAWADGSTAAPTGAPPTGSATAVPTATITDGDAIRGATVYQVCMGCHSLDEDD